MIIRNINFVICMLSKIYCEVKLYFCKNFKYPNMGICVVFRAFSGYLFTERALSTLKLAYFIFDQAQKINFKLILRHF